MHKNKLIILMASLIVVFIFVQFNTLHAVVLTTVNDFEIRGTIDQEDGEWIWIKRNGVGNAIKFPKIGIKYLETEDNYYLRLGDAIKEKGDTTKAIQNYVLSLQSNSTNSTAREKFVDLILSLENKDLPFLSAKTTEETKLICSILETVGDICLSKEYYTRATCVYSKLLVYQPDNGIIKENIKNAEKAIQEKIKEQQIKIADNLFQIGETAFKQNDKLRAKQFYQLALKYNPEHKDAREKLEHMRDELIAGMEAEKEARKNNYLSHHRVPSDYEWLNQEQEEQKSLQEYIQILNSSEQLRKKYEAETRERIRKSIAW